MPRGKPRQVRVKAHYRKVKGGKRVRVRAHLRKAPRKR